ncbi:WXG100 family type VII secretion target [Actinophytocola oryzae]|uniref:Uncharacterized protein YukE n=1 Tax=Actinophytocola oryzae TaxID=502181 RepID=A0A4V3FUF3_9PSEU|nr:WXG100 family type VII secretion target [Actinophytocola oryzae]TDV55001.1 uncharacterized protein YukE [Actinophytocola oryzae]
MAPQGIQLDQDIMAKAAKDFNDTSTSIRDLMSRLNSDVSGLVGATSHFNGAQRMAFDQNQVLLNEKIQKAGHELTVIADKFNQTMGTHAQYADDQARRINEAGAPLNTGTGTVVTGLNGFA